MSRGQVKLARIKLRRSRAPQLYISRLFKSTEKVFLFGKASMDTALPATRARVATVSGNVTYPFDLKTAGANRAEMLAAPPLFFLSFRTLLSFFFFFSLFYNAFGLVRFSSYEDQCWAEKVIIWIVLLNLHGAIRSTRFCNNRASSYLHGCHSFCNTWVNTAQKWSWWRN